MELLGLDAACAVFGDWLEPHPSPVARASGLFARLRRKRQRYKWPTLHIYWDRNPPEQICQLLDHNRSVCRQLGVELRLWNDDNARALLTAYSPEALRAYDVAPHPSMKSDVLRHAIIHAHGGIYLDADMGLSPEAGQLWENLDESLLFKWTLEERVNAPSWCFGFEPRHPAAHYALQETARSIIAAVAKDPGQALKSILAVSGPGLFTRAYGSWLNSMERTPRVRVLSVETAYRWVQNGPAILKAPLAYKKTDLHWLVAGNKR